MKYLNIVACCISLTSMVAYAQVHKRALPKMPEQIKEITKDTKTGFMLGFESGFNLIWGHDSDRFVVDSGLKIGYNLFFTKEWGMRLYGSYTYSFSDFVTAYKGAIAIENLYANAHIFLFNADMLYDFYNNKDLKLSLGIILGMGAGYELNAQKTYRNTTANETYSYTQSGFRVALNAGFSLAFASQHRIEILYRYTLLQPALHNIVSNNGTIQREETYNLQSPFSFHLGYSFIF